MTFSNYLLFLQKILELNPFTVVDLFFFVCFLIYIASERQRTFLQSVLTFLLSAGVIFISLWSYWILSEFIQLQFFATKGFADGISFLTILLILGGMAVVGYRLLLLNIDAHLEEIKLPILNILFGSITFIIIVAALSAVTLSFPLTPFIKRNVSSSNILNILAVNLQSVESTQRRLISSPSYSLMNFLTINPQGEDSVNIPSGELHATNVEEAENLIEQINTYRESASVSKLTFSEDLSRIAQTLTYNISQTQTLSRSQVNGSTPFDLLAQARIPYSTAYFIPFHSQSSTLGFNGMIQTSEYRQAIVSPSYANMGVGVVKIKEHGYVFTILLSN